MKSCKDCHYYYPEIQTQRIETWDWCDRYRRQIKDVSAGCELWKPRLYETMKVKEIRLL